MIEKEEFGRRSFIYWAELGTLEKAAGKLALEGILSPITGKPFTVAYVHRMALKWLVNHPDKARPYLEEEYNRTGEVLTDDEWERFLWKKAKQAYYKSEHQFEVWVNTIGKETKIGKEILSGEGTDS